MSMPNESLWEKRKRRILGEASTPIEVSSANAWVSIHGSSKEALLTYESRGLVVAVHGSGSLAATHPQVHEAEILAKQVQDRGGIVLTGGRNSGVMLGATKGAGDKSVGIIFPELKQETASPHIVIVNSPTPRIELLGTCAPVTVIFRGGMGTLMVLLRAIVHVRNRSYHKEQPHQVVYVSSYWIALLTSMMSMGALKREFLAQLKFFDTTSQIVPILKT